MGSGSQGMGQQCKGCAAAGAWGRACSPVPAWPHAPAAADPWHWAARGKCLHCGLAPMQHVGRLGEHGGGRAGAGTSRGGGKLKQRGRGAGGALGCTRLHCGLAVAGWHACSI